MSTTKIRPLQPYLNIPKSGYGLNSTGNKPNNIINVLSTINFGNKLFHETRFSSLEYFTLQPNSVANSLGLNYIPDRMLNAYYPSYNDSKNITISKTNMAFKDNKYNFYAGKFEDGYPENNTYTLCEKLSTIWTNGGRTFTTRTTTDDTGYPYDNSFGIVKGISVNVCQTNSCNKTCPTGFNLDPSSCLCVKKETCVPQPSCSPITIPLVKNTIYGYAFYTAQPRTVNIPEIGNKNTTCGGGHGCCRTIFRPYLQSSNTTIFADRNISMDNLPGCPQTQIPPDGWVPSDYYDRADTFTFTVPDVSILQNCSIFLSCQTLINNQLACHNGVTMVFLVAHDAITDDPILIFASCLLPGLSNAKTIGTLDCNDDLTHTQDCEPNPPVPSPPVCPDSVGYITSENVNTTIVGLGVSSSPTIVDINGNNQDNFTGYASFTTTQAGGSVYVSYLVSSESLGDIASVKINGSTYDSLSGVGFTNSFVIPVEIGDIITFEYKKDSSVTSGLDTAQFLMYYCGPIIDPTPTPPPPSPSTSPECTVNLLLVTPCDENGDIPGGGSPGQNDMDGVLSTLTGMGYKEVYAEYSTDPVGWFVYGCCANDAPPHGGVVIIDVCGVPFTFQFCGL